MKTSIALLAAPIFALALSVAPHAAVSPAKAPTQVADTTTDVTITILPGMVYRG